ncbi:MAG: NAD(P)H-dependent oxidoreductase subunit E [Candidatus Gastranaerophilales bacterium]|jgi:NADH:ubiquinone oxidoreductase subunit E|nr:NAD(P)H-dependent oxidoreductase subunit E [Candidatus Gastranaerophilales bacterium]
MSKIDVEICIGTACFVMGANKLQDLEELFPPEWENLVDVKASPCLNLCSNNEYSKAPYVKINGEVLSEATVEKVMQEIEKNLKK